MFQMNRSYGEFGWVPAFREVCKEVSREASSTGRWPEENRLYQEDHQKTAKDCQKGSKSDTYLAYHKPSKLDAKDS